jgi:hypothetical protein
MWSWVLRDFDRRVTANCTSKLQTRPLVREGVPQHDDRKCTTVIKIWPWVPDGGPTPKQTDRLTVGHKLQPEPQKKIVTTLQHSLSRNKHLDLG